FSGDIAGKGMQLLKEISPGVRRIVVIYNPDTAPYRIFLPTMETVAPQLGLTLIQRSVRDKAAIEGIIGELAGGSDAGLMIMPDIFLLLHRLLIFSLAAAGRLPSMCPLQNFTLAGGLVSDGSDFDSLIRQA